MARTSRRRFLGSVGGAAAVTTTNAGAAAAPRRRTGQITEAVVEVETT